MRSSGAVRRDWLMRQVEKGRVVAVGSYHFDDMTGGHRGKWEGAPVAIAPADWHDRKEGTVYIRRDEFEGKVGRAYAGENGIVTLYVHSNSNYTLRVSA